MNKGHKMLKRLTLAAMLIAMSVVIGIFCKSVLNFAGGLMRITFENLPIILGGIILGPIWAGAIGLVSDLSSYFLSPQAFAPMPIVTLGAVLIGVVSGIVSRYIIRRRGSLRIILTVSAAHLIGSMAVKTVGLFTIYGWAVLVRIPIYILITAVEALLICLLYKNSGFRRMAEELEK